LAAAQSGCVVPVYILDDQTPGRWKIGGAQRWWLHHSLTSLQRALERLGSRLILRRGRVEEELKRIASELGTRRVHALRHYEPWWQEAEQRVAADLELVMHAGDVLVPPQQVRTAVGSAYKIYTPYWRALQNHLPPPRPRPCPQEVDAPESWPESDDLDSWALLPTQPNWAIRFADEWLPGEENALRVAGEFALQSDRYLTRRDLPSELGTSRLSPHLRFGEISPRHVWHSLPAEGGEKFQKELAWRDFCRNVMLTQPAIGERAGRREFDAFPWRKGPKAEADFRAWTRGRTGYPLVDAGMRQLWATGWMHNRVRMVSASFLVKHLLIDWRLGVDWFWDTLVDADYGNNGQNWQWIAGTGIDSQPFNRIMAPLAQAEKFSAADYIRRWVAELSHVSDRLIYEPSKLPRDAYGEPIVEHGHARQRALEALRAFAGDRSRAHMNIATSQ
jgi:deoxyribodipyrimidine photo-lyase